MKRVSFQGKYFIVGCARSGTTLMQQLISSHSLVVGVNETGFLQQISFKEKNIDKIVSKIALNEKEYQLIIRHLQKFFKKREPNKKLGLFQIFDAYCQAHQLFFHKAAYVEKTPFHSFFMKEILSEIPNSKIIVMLRDPRAIIASRLVSRKPFSRGKKWHLPRKIQIFLNLSEIFFTYQRFEKWYQINHPRVFFVKYEDLVKNPKEIIKKVLKFLKLPFEPIYDNINPLDMRLNTKKVKGMMNSSYQKTKTNKVSLASLERWRQVLIPSENEFIKKWSSQIELKLLKDFYPFLFSYKKSF